MKNEVIIQKIDENKDSKSPYLDLSYLNLIKVPDEVYSLVWLTELHLNNNFLCEIDPEKFSQLRKLQFLNLSHNLFNHVSGLPFPLGNTSSINHLDISYNNFQTLPNELQNTRGLEYLNFAGNPCQFNIPLEFRNRNIQSVLNYLYEVELSKHVIPLHEGKLIFVGNGDVGKTTLIKKLTEKKFKLKLGEELTTRGIDIKQWIVQMPNRKRYNFYLPSGDEGEIENGFEEEFKEEFEDYFEDNKVEDFDVTLNIWDFGGQEIYRSTHQFFMTKRSIYLLLWESRKDEVHSNLDNWLNTISLLGGNSPILVIQNKIDSRTTELNKQELKEKFRNIHNFYDVSCLNGNGINLLKSDLIHVISDLPHLGDKLPKSWFEIKELLSKINSDFISYDQFIDHCKKFRIEGNRAEFVSEYLHDLGFIIHFKNDFLLRDIVILNPEWATRSVYILLDNPKIISNHGRFKEQDLQEYWDNKVYPKHKHPHLLRLITKFELCFKLNYTAEYLLPELLAIDNSVNKEEFISAKELWYEYNYRFLPAGIITRLICRTSHLIDNSRLTKNAIFLSFEDSRGIVLLNTIEKKISVIITGPSSNELHGIIKDNIFEIHVSLNLKSPDEFQEFVCCSCEECLSNYFEPHFFDMQTVKRFLEKGKETIECQKSGFNIIIKELIKPYLKSKSTLDLTSIILKSCSKVQGLRLAINKDENSINTILAQTIHQSNINKLIVKDQTLWGSSSTGKKPGEIDLKIEDSQGNTLGLVEAFRLKTLNKSIIDLHLDKIFKYDVNGLMANYIVVYSEATDFLKLWEKYLHFIKLKSFLYPQLGNPKELDKYFSSSSEIKGAYTTHRRSGLEINLFHIFLNFRN